MSWRASNRYSFWDWDLFPVNPENSFAMIPTKAQSEALATALDYFIKGEIPPEED
jgi:hypothetical protein